jgi:heme/copper-type cytochrome/quinol oxidase subunit 2
VEGTGARLRGPDFLMLGDKYVPLPLKVARPPSTRGAPGEEDATSECVEGEMMMMLMMIMMMLLLLLLLLMLMMMMIRRRRTRDSGHNHDNDNDGR